MPPRLVQRTLLRKRKEMVLLVPTILSAAAAPVKVAVVVQLMAQHVIPIRIVAATRVAVRTISVHKVYLRIGRVLFLS